MPSRQDWDLIRPYVPDDIKDRPDVYDERVRQGHVRFELGIGAWLSEKPFIPSAHTVLQSRAILFKNAMREEFVGRCRATEIVNGFSNPAWSTRVPHEQLRVRNQMSELFARAQNPMEKLHAIAVYTGQTWHVQPCCDGNTRTSYAIGVALSRGVFGRQAPELRPEEIKEGLIDFVSRGDVTNLAFSLSNVELPPELRLSSYRRDMWRALFDYGILVPPFQFARDSKVGCYCSAQSAMTNAHS